MTLVILGGAWLASSLGLMTEAWWEVALPLLLLAWGFSVLWSGFRGTDRGAGGEVSS